MRVSTNAKTCPHCGVQDPTGEIGKKNARGCLGIILFIALFVSWVTFCQREQTPEKAAQEQGFSADYDVLANAGRLAVTSGDAEKYEISGWNGSLDLYIANRLTFKAASLANYFCDGFFTKAFRSATNWRVRVYLADGSVGAECKIITGSS